MYILLIPRSDKYTLSIEGANDIFLDLFQRNIVLLGRIMLSEKKSMVKSNKIIIK